MSSFTRLFRLLAICLAAVPAFAADAAKQPAPTPAGRPALRAETVEFAGVSTVGKKTLINLYDTATKRNFWIEVGTTSRGVTVVRYDSQRDQITLRQDGAERTLGLKAATVSANAPVVTPAPAPTNPVTTAPAAPAAPLSQARQEEEARMLVSDLLEIGMVQRRAYEEARRKAAAGQTTATPSTPTTDTTPVASSPEQPAPATPTPTPSGG